MACEPPGEARAVLPHKGARQQPVQHLLGSQCMELGRCTSGRSEGALASTWSCNPQNLLCFGIAAHTGHWEQPDHLAGLVESQQNCDGHNDRTAPACDSPAHAVLVLGHLRLWVCLILQGQSRRT